MSTLQEVYILHPDGDFYAVSSRCAYLAKKSALNLLAPYFNVVRDVVFESSVAFDKPTVVFHEPPEVVDVFLKWLDDDSYVPWFSPPESLDDHPY